jgi:HAD superfamily hydrolase (TIGR01509 family)
MEKTQFGIIWDQTGVLYKYGSNNVTKSFTTVLGRYGIKAVEGMFGEKYRGTSLKNQAEMWKRDFNIVIPIPIIQFSKEAFAVEAAMIDTKKEYDPNLIAFLENMSKRGVPMVVGSSSTRERAEKILEVLNLRKYFKGVVSCEDVKNHEPSTDTLTEASKRLGVGLDKCIVIEDSASGIRAAKKAGCLAIGYAIYSEEQYQSLVGAKADKVIRDFKDLTSGLIEKLLEERR